MTQIVAAQIGTQDKADGARRALVELGYADSQVEVFFVTPPGEHGLFPIGGDRDADPGAQREGQGALTGGALGAVAGVALGGMAAVAVPLLAPAVFATVAASGVLGGVVVGGLSEAGRTPEDHGGAGTTSAEQDDPAGGAITADTSAHVLADTRERAEQQAEHARSESGAGTHRGGLMIAVDVGASGDRAEARADRVIETLQRCGALALERADGDWRNGHWVDFDPLRAMSGPREGAL